MRIKGTWCGIDFAIRSGRDRIPYYHIVNDEWNEDNCPWYARHIFIGWGGDYKRNAYYKHQILWAFRLWPFGPERYPMTNNTLMRRTQQ